MYSSLWWNLQDRLITWQPTPVILLHDSFFYNIHSYYSDIYEWKFCNALNKRKHGRLKTSSLLNLGYFRWRLSDLLNMFWLEWRLSDPQDLSWLGWRLSNLVLLNHGCRVVKAFSADAALVMLVTECSLGLLTLSKNKLERIQNEAMRVVLRCTWDTLITGMCYLLDMPNIKVGC